MKNSLLLIVLLAFPLQAEVYNINQLKLDNYLGKVVYLDFWASWCKPCNQSFPWMNELVARYPAESFTVVTINLDQETEEMHSFLAKVSADFDIYHDPSGHIAEQFGIEVMPTSYLIDTDGKVVKKHLGFYTIQIGQYEKEIESLL